MKVILGRQFRKSYKKLQDGEKRKFALRRNLFLESPLDPRLNSHILHGDYSGYRSINITGDLRVIYKPLGDNLALFIDIGTHHELYGK